MEQTGPTERATRESAILQTRLIGAELKQLDDQSNDYSERRANQAAVYARQDLVLIYSMICSAHDRAVTTNRLLMVCIALLVLILFAVSA